MSKQYFELSTDYDLADKLLREGQTLAAWMVFNQNPLVFNTDYKQLRVFSISDNKLFVDGLKPPSDFTYEKYLVDFLLPVDLPNTTELQHSLTQALNECDELRVERKKYRERAENTITEVGQEYNNQIQALEDNLTRSQSDRLSELTTIIRMIQALSDTPQDCYYGAIRLIHQVIYDQICRLDPTQVWDI